MANYVCFSGGLEGGYSKTISGEPEYGINLWIPNYYISILTHIIPGLRVMTSHFQTLSGEPSVIRLTKHTKWR